MDSSTKSCLFFLLLIGVNLCRTTNAEITGNALFSADLIKENGEWSRDIEQRINLNLRGKVGLEHLFGLGLGFVWRGKEWSLLGGLIPTYALNLQGKHYNLSSGYSVRMYRDIISSRLYNNLSVFLPGLPAFKLAYTKQGTRDILKEHRINSTGNNIHLEMEDEIGPFHLAFNRREYSSRDLARGPNYDVKSSDTSGDIDFTYSYRRLFYLGGRYGIGQLRTERGATGEIKEKRRNFSLDFRISPTSTIALSGTTSGQQEQRENLKRKIFSTTLTKRLQLMLQPVEEILLNATYFKGDNSQEEEFLSEEFLSNESKSLALSIEPRENLVFSGNFTVYDVLDSNKKLSILRRKSFDLRAEPIEGLQITSRIDLLKSEDFVSGFLSDRNNVTIVVEAMPTTNLRTEISYDWQKFSRRLEDIIEQETRHRMVFSANYSFVRMLTFNLRSGQDISGKWENGTTFLTCGLNYLRDNSHINFRYHRVISTGRSPSSRQERRRKTRTLTVEFGQEVGRNTDLRLNYENRFSDGVFGYRRGMKRISFRANIRF